MRWWRVLTGKVTPRKCFYKICTLTFRTFCLWINLKRHNVRHSRVEMNWLCCYHLFHFKQWTTISSTEWHNSFTSLQMVSFNRHQMHHRRLGSQKSLCVCLSVYLTHNFNRVLLLPSITKLRNNFHLGIVSTKFLAHQKKGVIYYYYYNILLLNCEAMPWYCVSHSIASIKIRDISWNDIANKDFAQNQTAIR